jgi:superkiller protein 3
MIYARQKKVSEAEPEFRTAIRLNPHQTQAVYQFAMLLQAQRRAEEAKTYFDQFSHLQQEEAEAERASILTQEGLKRFRDGNLDGAVAAFREALQADPSYAMAAHCLGVAFIRQGKLQEAAEAFRLAIRLRPSLAVSRQELAALLRREGDPAADQVSRAAQLLNRLIPQQSAMPIESAADPGTPTTPEPKVPYDQPPFN